MMLATAGAAALVNAQSAAAGLRQQIESLGALDFPARTRAARLIRRTPAADAVPALAQAARSDPNEFVRYRALVLLTAFYDPATPALMRELMQDRNDRIREVAYEWFEWHPDPVMAKPLIAALGTEQAEFVRPALVSALAALGSEAIVQRFMIEEASRGPDFFRSAVIESLGRHRAAFALDAVVVAARVTGPLQDDAVLAIGRIGGPDAAAVLNELPEVTPEASAAGRAARCLIGDGCPEQLTALASIAAGESSAAETRAAIEALSAVAQSRHEAALAALLDLPRRRPALRESVAVAVGTVAIRQPDWFVTWLEATAGATGDLAMALVKDGFDALEEDYGEEQFFASVRAGYWRAGEGSGGRTLRESLIRLLEF